MIKRRTNQSNDPEHCFDELFVLVEHDQITCSPLPYPVFHRPQSRDFVYQEITLLQQRLQESTAT